MNGLPQEKEQNGSDKTEHLDLYVKSGQDGSSLGGCPFCQRIFMILMIKHNAGALTFNATTVDVAHPPKDWKLGHQLPILVHRDEVFTEVEEMVAYIDKAFPDPPMLPELPAANNACVNTFSKFNFYVKSGGSVKGPEALEAELRKFDSYLRNSPHTFLCGDELSHLDCIMLPKLQHIRVVAKAFKDFDIPANMEGLWSYLGNAYREPVFTESCPSDQEIVYHWQGRPGLPPLTKEAQSHYRTTTKPRYSLDDPLQAPPTPDEKFEQQNDVFAESTPKAASAPPVSPPAQEPSPPAQQNDVPDAPAAFSNSAPEIPEPAVQAQATPEVESAPKMADDDAVKADAAAPPAPEAEASAPPTTESAPAPIAAADASAPPAVADASSPPAAADASSPPAVADASAPPAVIDASAPPSTEAASAPPIEAASAPPAVADQSPEVVPADAQSPPPATEATAPADPLQNGDAAPIKYAAEPFPIS